MTTDALLADMLTTIVRWAAQQPAMLAAALVGSHARDAARVDSDVDIMLIVTDPDRFRDDGQWLADIDWASLNRRVDHWQDEAYGIAWSRRVWLTDGMEIEFTFGPSAWAAIDPVDAGTLRVVQDGCRILLDPAGTLQRLLRHIRGD